MNITVTKDGDAVEAKGELNLTVSEARALVLALAISGDASDEEQRKVLAETLTALADNAEQPV